MVELPLELFMAIACHLTGMQAEQASLACTSRALNDIVTPLLYHSVAITSHQSFVNFSRLAGLLGPSTIPATVDTVARRADAPFRPDPQTPSSSLTFVRDLAVWYKADSSEDTSNLQRCSRLCAIALACPNLTTLLVHPSEPNLDFLRELDSYRSGDASKELHYINVRTDHVDSLLAGWNNATYLPCITRMFLETEAYLHSLLPRELGNGHPGTYSAYDPVTGRWHRAPILRVRFRNLTHLVLTCRNNSTQYTPDRVALIVRVFLKSFPRLERLLLVVRHPVAVDNRNKDNHRKRDVFKLPHIRDTRVWLEIVAIGDPRVYGIVDPTDPGLSARAAVDEWKGAHGWESMLWRNFVLKQTFSWESGIRMCPD